MKIIEKKTWPEYFEAVVSGKKKFEVRLADFDLAEGDVLILKEWNPKTKKYTGRSIEKKVEYLVRFNPNDFFGQENEVKEKGLYIIGIK